MHTRPRLSPEGPILQYLLQIARPAGVNFQFQHLASNFTDKRSASKKKRGIALVVELVDVDPEDFILRASRFSRDLRSGFFAGFKPTGGNSNRRLRWRSESRPSRGRLIIIGVYVFLSRTSSFGVSPSDDRISPGATAQLRMFNEPQKPAPDRAAIEVSSSTTITSTSLTGLYQATKLRTGEQWFILLNYPEGLRMMLNQSAAIFKPDDRPGCAGSDALLIENRSRNFMSSRTGRFRST